MVAFKDGDDREAIFRAVQNMYTQVALSPGTVFHFPTGRRACLYNGYPASLLNGIPETAIESFAGVGYPFAACAILAGDVVLDVGSGAGTDAFLASQSAGRTGKVMGVDMTPAMLQKARNNAKDMTGSIEFLEGNAEKLPLPDGIVDVVTSNGVLNLVPNKAEAFSELFRVLRAGGRFQISDIAVGKPILEKSRKDPTLWAECIVGAILESDYLELLRRVGFVDVSVINRFDYFAKSSSLETRQVASHFQAISVTIRGRKPQ